MHRRSINCMAVGARAPGPIASRRESHSAPRAAAPLSATPTQVVARRPTAGSNQNPAPIAPAAAPAVFAAYRTPASAADRLLAGAFIVTYASTNHDAAIGNVAPMAAAGTASSARLSVTRTSPNRTGASPSAYAHAITGSNSFRIAGSAMAISATTISSTAYA